MTKSSFRPPLSLQKGADYIITYAYLPPRDHYDMTIQRLSLLLYLLDYTWFETFYTRLLTNDFQMGSILPICGLEEKYARYRVRPIPRPKDFSFSDVPESIKLKLNAILDEIFIYATWKLKDMTYNSAPWKNALKKNEHLMHTLKFGGE